MRPLRPENERRVLAVAWKILTRGVRPERDPSSACGLPAALLARADLCGAPLDRLADWRAEHPGLRGESAACRDARRGLARALDSVRELLGRLCRLYGVRTLPAGEGLPLAWRGESRPPAGYRPAPCRAVPVEGAGEEDLLWLLRLLFGRDSFLPGQSEAVRLILEGRDTVVLLPTGAGKSLVFQLAAMLRPGPCVVVEPTLSLIDDQLEHLAEAGIRRAVSVTGRGGAEGRSRALAALSEGGLCFCYVAPERFQTRGFRRALRLLAVGDGLGLVAVDEAHCVSEWGHDFRVAYLQVARILRRESGERGIPLAALTGTASAAVLEDLRRVLGMGAGGASVSTVSRRRPELSFRVVRCRSGEQPARLAGLLGGMPALWGEEPGEFFRPRRPGARCGIVFCPHVEGPFGAQSFAADLRRRGFEVEVYHGRPPRGEDPRRWEELKRSAAGRFCRDESALLAATKAFGLGIDKPNIRFTLHAGLPPSVESFYQEAGRAGRDRAPARCWLLVSVEDVPRARWLLDEKTPVEDIMAELEDTPPGDEDDVLRVLRLHTQAFRGGAREAEDIREVLSRLGAPSARGLRRIAFPFQSRSLVEKALYRLLCLGIVEDYTVGYGSGVFDVRLSGAGPEDVRRALARHAESAGAPGIARRAMDLAGGDGFLERALGLLLELVYETVERARRRSMREMLECCLPGVGQEEFSRRLYAALSV